MTELLGAAGLLMLFVGGEALVRGASSFALRFGLSPLSVGLTVVAFGTSTPELVVSLDAAFAGVPDIALGNVIGSNIANVTLILGIAMILGPARAVARTVRVDAPVVVAVSLVLVFMLRDDLVSRIEGIALVTALVVFTGITLVQGREESVEVKEEFAEALEGPTHGAVVSAVLVLLGLVALVVGGQLFVDAAVLMARTFGLSEAVIGLTVVALGTSLPELVTAVIAALRGHGDIALGSVLGSNLFNVLGILGVTSLVLPLRPEGISATTRWMMVASALIVAIVAYTGRRISRLEGSVLLSGYVLYVGWLLVG